MSQEEKFIKELKELTFGIHKSGRSYGARMFRNFKDEYEARKAQKNLQSLGSIDERNNHYQLKIYEKEVRTLLTKYLPEIIDGKEEVLSQIIIDYDFLSQDVPCHRKDERKLLYDRLWEFRHPNLTKPEESPTLLEYEIPSYEPVKMEEGFLAQLKTLKFGIYKNGNSHMGRLFKSYKSRLAADMAHDRLQGYGSVKKNGNYYILSIYTSETVELLLNDDTFLSYTEDMDEKLSRIIWDYVWAGKADPRRQKELRQKAYERLKLYYHPNLHVEEPAYELPDADEMVNEYF